MSTNVVAGGAVVVRKGPEVLLVHRPKYDDWSFPKGKQDPGEHVTATATREVLEETGVEIRLCRPLADQLYPVASGRLKEVHYWVGRVLGDDDVSTYEPNKEVDDLRWCSLDKARRLLTYADDGEVLDAFVGLRKKTRTIVVVRHARARKRKTWRGDDTVRPLTDVGLEQASALRPVLHAYGVTRVISSPSTRCVQTVKPYADEQVLPLERLDGLTEEEFSPQTAIAVAADALASPESLAICTHRPVLPELLGALGVDVEPLAPGEMLVLHHRKGKVLATERHQVR
jgi:8-oxo-dGTP diphosphatase